VVRRVYDPGTTSSTHRTTTSTRPAPWSGTPGTGAARRFVENVTGHLLGGVNGDVLQRAFDYRKDVDSDTGNRIEATVRAARNRA